jgi:transcriptional regulator with XRE-family HTH domain
LRHWRSVRGFSQLALAVRVETTTRHLSYVENGRSRPGRDLVLRFAEALDLPLRARNDLLAAAGLASEFPASEIASAALAPYRRAVLRLIDSMHPFPAFVVDPMFNLEETNDAGRRLLPGLAPGKRINLVDAFLAPGPSRASIANFSEVAWTWYARFLRATAGLAPAAVKPLRERIQGHLRDVPRPPADASGDPVVCPTFRIGDITVRTIGMTLRFGPSRDVTLEELSVDVLYPRDEQAERFFHDLARRR